MIVGCFVLVGSSIAQAEYFPPKCEISLFTVDQFFNEPFQLDLVFAETIFDSDTNQQRAQNLALYSLLFFSLMFNVYLIFRVLYFRQNFKIDR